MDKQDEINGTVYRILIDIYNKVHCQQDFEKLSKLIKEEKERKEVPLYRG